MACQCCSLRLVLFLVICSCIIPFLPSIVNYERQHFQPQSVYSLTLLVTAILLVFGFTFFSTALPILCTVGLAVLLTPTAQVWFCSPCRLTNFDLSKDVDARGEARELVKFCIGKCLRDMPFGDLYRLSLCTPALTLYVNGSDVQNVSRMSNTTDEQQVQYLINKSCMIIYLN